MRAEAPLPRTYYFINLGCPKNLVDAERVAARLEAAGWREAAASAEASLVVVTTCAFISSAMEESVDEILAAGAAKREGQTLAVLGCLVSRERSALRRLLPEVDLFLDVAEMLSLPERLDEMALPGGPAAPLTASLTIDCGERKLFTPGHLAYLKIADGCSNRCSYCMIPSIRGDLRSRTMAEILEEARRLADAGVRELVLVAQDTTAWGFDLAGRERLYDLIASIADAARFDWVRLMYLHPAHVDIERLVPLARGGAVLPYLDIPIQHVGDRILGAMGRGYCRADLESLFEALRARIDDLVLRTTVMVGFPGETDEEFRELVDFIETVSFDHVGVFTYSPERGTKARSRRPRVPEALAAGRRDELLNVQLDISHERLSARVGSALDILVDSAVDVDERPEPGVEWVGRFFGQAYDIDGVTYLKGSTMRPGDFVKATVIEAQPYDLVARVL
jgi:ribosomal protein S12 methylthiotransferase